MDHAKKKQLKELKRKQKKQAIARESTGDYWKRYPVVEADITCHVVGVLELDQQCSLMVLRKLPNGHSVIALFLIDRGVLGLKDAWGLSDTNLAEYNGRLETARESSKVSRILLEDARTLIAAAIKHRNDFGFRLPQQWERWTSVLGGVGLWRVADTSRFIPEFAESYDYLQRHLAVGRAEEFARRQDLSFDWKDEGFEDDDEVDDEFDVPTLEEWERPTREDFLRLLELNEKVPAKDAGYPLLRETMALMGFEIGPHFDQLARFWSAALLGPVEIDSLPVEIVDLVPAPVLTAETTWYFLQIVNAFEDPLPSVEECCQVAAAGGLFMIRTLAMFQEDRRSDEAWAASHETVAKRMAQAIYSLGGLRRFASLPDAESEKA